MLRENGEGDTLFRVVAQLSEYMHQVLKVRRDESLRRGDDFERLFITLRNFEIPLSKLDCILTEFHIKIFDSHPHCILYIKLKYNRKCTFMYIENNNNKIFLRFVNLHI